MRFAESLGFLPRHQKIVESELLLACQESYKYSTFLLKSDMEQIKSSPTAVSDAIKANKYSFLLLVRGRRK
jgi:hypothetical protein